MTQAPGLADEAIESTTEGAAGPRSPGALAYLVNQYPQPSQSFIRREIAAIEAAGTPVIRYTLRAFRGTLADPADEAERGQARAILSVGALGLMKATAAALLSRPRSFLKAASLAARIGRKSGRGAAIHGIYLAEACVLKGWAKAAGVSHVHAHFGTNSATVAMLARLLGGPSYSVTVHGPEEFDAPGPLALREKVEHSAFVAAVSDYGRSQLFRWARYEDWPKVRVVPCGVDAPFLESAPSPAPEAPRLVCVGRLAEQKGQLVLVEAAALLRDEGVDFQIDLIGDGPLRGELESAIARLDLADRVHLVGLRSNAGVREAILGARALVLPSFAEGLPVVLMEALAMGRPAISTYVAGIPELIEPGVNGWLVPAGAAGPLASAMKEALLAAPEDLDRMGRLGRSAVARRHDARRSAALLSTLFPASEGSP